MSRSGLGLQHELAAHRHDAVTLVQRAADSSTFLPELPVQFDAITLVLFVATLIAFFVPVFTLFPPVPVERSDALSQTHSRLGLPPERSNLRQQLSAAHSPPAAGEQPTVQSLRIYPVKSCMGIELDRCKILPTGLEHDCLFTFAQLHAPAPGYASSTGDSKQPNPLWEPVTQRQLPLLETVHVDLWIPDPAKTSRQLGKVEDAFLVVRFPWMDRGLRGLIQWIASKVSRGIHALPEKEFMLPVSFPSNKEIKDQGYGFADVKICNDVVYALNFETEIPPELPLYLGVKHKLSLFRANPSSPRRASRLEESKTALGYQPSLFFQDSYPLHMISLTSMQNLDSLLLKDEMMKGLDACKLGANITISGSKEYEEETRDVINLEHPSTKEQCQFEVACRTVRCTLPNVEAGSGIRHMVEPNRAPKEFRKVNASGPKSGCLGMELCPLFPQATNSEGLVSYIEVGMYLDVLKHGSRVNVKQ